MFCFSVFGGVGVGGRCCGFLGVFCIPLTIVPLVRWWSFHRILSCVEQAIFCEQSGEWFYTLQDLLLFSKVTLLPCWNIFRLVISLICQKSRRKASILPHLLNVVISVVRFLSRRLMELPGVPFILITVSP